MSKCTIKASQDQGSKNWDWRDAVALEEIASTTGFIPDTDSRNWEWRAAVAAEWIAVNGGGGEGQPTNITSLDPRTVIGGSGYSRTIDTTGITGGDAVWGDITGTLSNQTDLNTKFLTKTDTLSINQNNTKGFASTVTCTNGLMTVYINGDIVPVTGSDDETLTIKGYVDAAVGGITIPVTDVEISGESIVQNGVAEVMAAGEYSVENPLVTRDYMGGEIVAATNLCVKYTDANQTVSSTNKVATMADLSSVIVSDNFATTTATLTPTQMETTSIDSSTLNILVGIVTVNMEIYDAEGTIGLVTAIDGTTLTVVTASVDNGAVIDDNNISSITTFSSDKIESLISTQAHTFSQPADVNWPGTECDNGDMLSDVSVDVSYIPEDKFSGKCDFNYRVVGGEYDWYNHPSLNFDYNGLLLFCGAASSQYMNIVDGEGNYAGDGTWEDGLGTTWSWTKDENFIHLTPSQRLQINEIDVDNTNNIGTAFEFHDSSEQTWDLIDVDSKVNTLQNEVNNLSQTGNFANVALGNLDADGEAKIHAQLGESNLSVQGLGDYVFTLAEYVVNTAGDYNNLTNRPVYAGSTGGYLGFASEGENPTEPIFVTLDSDQKDILSSLEFNIAGQLTTTNEGWTTLQLMANNGITKYISIETPSGGIVNFEDVVVINNTNMSPPDWQQCKDATEWNLLPVDTDTTISTDAENNNFVLYANLGVPNDTIYNSSTDEELVGMNKLTELLSSGIYAVDTLANQANWDITKRILVNVGEDDYDIYTWAQVSGTPQWLKVANINDLNLGDYPTVDQMNSAISTAISTATANLVTTTAMNTALNLKQNKCTYGSFTIAFPASPTTGSYTGTFTVPSGTTANQILVMNQGQQSRKLILSCANISVSGTTATYTVYPFVTNDSTSSAVTVTFIYHLIAA